jgi:ABC-type Fe3+-hydroxamate transport system substrate-binding protein
VRVVSLVPSVTESLLALGVTPVACTRFCEQPGLPTVGGTKDPDVGAIVALAPDLVVVNDEENRREDAAALTAAGIPVHEMSPRAVQDVGPALAALAAAVGVAAPVVAVPPARAVRGAAVTFVWRRPWMSMTADTYGASVLAHLGWVDALGAGGAGGAARYPELPLAAAAALAPDLVVLPSEPYPFGARHRPEVATAVPGAVVVTVDGRDLFWWGTRTPGALVRLATTIGRAVDPAAEPRE